MTAAGWSVPEPERIAAIERRLEAADDGQAVLATIVHVDGNAYRRPGATSLLTPEGDGFGAITAGCLEDDLLAAAADVRDHGRPQLVTYDLLDDDEDVWGLGVGCNGRIEVLLEPLSAAYRPVVAAYHEGRDIAVCTVLEGLKGDRTEAGTEPGPGTKTGTLEQSDRLYYYPEQESFSSLDGTSAPDTWPTDRLAGPAEQLADRGRADTVEIDVDGQSTRVFIDGFASPDELVIFGSGHDVGPVVELGAKNGFRVTVVGFRGAVDLEERFPAATRTVTTAPARFTDEIDLGPRTYTVVMTHNFLDDQLTVASLLESDLPYVGLMGPTERFDELLEGLSADGYELTEATLERLYTPIGLDLGDGSPYGIAHSIIAEVHTVANDRSPRHLRETAGHIHERIDVGAPSSSDS